MVTGWNRGYLDVQVSLKTAGLPVNSSNLQYSCEGERMKGWVYLLIAIVSEVIGTSGLKASAEFTRLWPSLATIFAYCTSFFFLSLTLRTIPVGIAYAVWGGVGIVLITIVGWAYFGQRLDAPAILGMSLIIAGVVILNVFSKTVPH